MSCTERTRYRPKRYVPTKQFKLNAPSNIQRDRLMKIYITLNAPSNIQRDGLIKIYITLNATILTNETGQKESIYTERV